MFKDHSDIYHTLNKYVYFELAKGAAQLGWPVAKGFTFIINKSVYLTTYAKLVKVKYQSILVETSRKYVSHSSSTVKVSFINPWHSERNLEHDRTAMIYLTYCTIIAFTITLNTNS